MKFVDLFAGIGGFHYAAKQVWPEAECVFASEIDKRAAETYRVNHGINPLNDITETDIASLPAADLLCAGFPCQAFSKNGKWYNAGKVVGEDDRANLFLYVVEYLNTHKPRFALLENVKGLTKIKNEDGSRYLDVIVGSLVDAGYSVHVKVLDSADYGLPQQRQRTYFACFQDDGSNFQWPRTQPRNTCIYDVMDFEVDPRYYLTNRWEGRMCQRLGGTRLEQLSISCGQRLRLSRENGDNLIRTGKINLLAAIYGDTPSGAPRQQDKLYSKWGISPTIATLSLSIPNVDADPWRVLTPRECARLQGFPEDLALPNNDNFAYRQIGNAISVPVAEAVLRQMGE